MDNDQKLTAFNNLCKDIGYREEVFKTSSSKECLELLSIREFPIKQMMNCAPFDLTQCLLPYEYTYSKISKRDKRVLKVSCEMQLDFIKKILDINTYNYNSIYLFNGISDFEKIRCLSLLYAFWTLKVNKYRHNDTAYNLGKPFYYLIKGGFDDSMRDLKGFKEQIGNTNLLILDGLSLQSSKLKIEKVIDIINMYSTSVFPINIIILSAGVDPLITASQYLNSTFQIGLLLDEGLITNI